MKNRVWWLVAILGASCFGGGYYVYAQKNAPKPASPDIWKEQYDQMSAIMKRVMGDGWDGWFADRSLGPKFTPFMDMDAIHRQIDRMSKDEYRDLFGLSWDDKLPFRMDVAAVNPVIRTTKDKVIVSLQVPRAKGDSFTVNIKKNEIRLGYEVSVLNEKRNSQGAYEKSASEERFQQIMPVPPDAVANTAKVTRDGNTVKIVFARQQKSLS